MDWTLIAGIGLTVWATLVVLSNERSAIETARRANGPTTAAPSDKPAAAKH